MVQFCIYRRLAELRPGVGEVLGWSQKQPRNPPDSYIDTGDFHQWRYPKMDGLYGKTIYKIYKWMMTAITPQISVKPPFTSK